MPATSTFRFTIPTPPPPVTTPTPPIPDSILVRARRIFSTSSFEGIPVLLFLLYVTGFLCLNTHLSRFPIVETNLLSFNYIKASLVFIIFNAIIISVARKIAREINKSRLLSNIVILLFVINVYCIVFYLYEKLTLDFLSKLSPQDATKGLYILGYTYFPSVFIILFHKTTGKKLLSLFILSLTVSIFLFCIDSTSCRMLLIYVLSVTIIFFSIFYQDYHNRGLYFGNLGLLIPLYGFLIAAVIMGFGAFVYEKIPQVIGGGKSYRAVLYLTKAEIQNLRDCCILDNDNSMQQEAAIIYSSEKGFYIDNNGMVIIIPIETLKGIKVKHRLWLDNSKE